MCILYFVATPSNIKISVEEIEQAAMEAEKQAEEAQRKAMELREMAKKAKQASLVRK